MDNQAQSPQPLRRPPVAYRRQIPPETPERISYAQGVLMVMFAAFIDLLQFLLTLVAIGAVMSPIITTGTIFAFWIWFKMLGISFIGNPKRLATFTIESVGELIPVIGALPMWSIGTIITIAITRSEDKGGVLGKLANTATQGIGRKAA